MQIRINFCQIFFIATCSVFPDFASRAIVRDKYKHYMKWYLVTAFLCGRAMFNLLRSCTVIVLLRLAFIVY